MAVSKKPTNPSSTLHPPYLQMIIEAISSLKDRNGSSQPAIAKFMEDKYSSLLPSNFKKMLSVQLKKFVKSEKLVKIKSSYKVSASENVKLVDAAIKQSEKKTDESKKEKNREKTKRLSQVKTPEALKKNLTAKKATPEALKKNLTAKKAKSVTSGKMKKVSSPVKRNASKSVKASKPAPKKVRT